jgi:hypothetical protein
MSDELHRGEQLLSRRISSASMAPEDGRELVPAGGATLTWRIFSEPALMNWVGRSGAMRPVSMNRAIDTPSTPSLVTRLRSAQVIVGV